MSKRAFLLLQIVVCLCCCCSANAQQTPRLPTLEEVASGICERYAKLRSLRVEFREDFIYYSQDREGGPWRGTPVQAEGTWTVELREDTPLSRARERLEVRFPQGASAFIRGPSDVNTGSAVYVWDGEQAKTLDQFVTANEKRRGSHGLIQQGGKTALRGELEIESFLFFWHRYEDLKTVKHGLTHPFDPIQIVGEETVNGVPCVLLEFISSRYDYRWRMALAPERDFVLMRLQAWSPQKEQKPSEWIAVEKIGRFGNLWFPTKGEYVERRPMSKRYWEHRFVITEVAVGAPFDEVLELKWPPGTAVRDIPAKIEYRVARDGGIPERTAALDEALAMARASRPPPVPSGPSWGKGIFLVLALLVASVAGFWAVLRWRRRTSLG